MRTIRCLDACHPTRIRTPQPVQDNVTIFRVDLPNDPEPSYYAWRWGEARFDEAGQFYETDVSLERVC